MKRFFKNLAYFAVALLITSFVSYCFGWISRNANMPPPNSNIQAYQYLAAASNSQDVRTMKAYSDMALQNTTDPDIKFMADLMSRMANQKLAAGISEKSEGNSFTGVLKSMNAQMKDPFLWLQALGITFDTFTNDTQKMTNDINERYQAYFQQIIRANEAGFKTGFYTFLALSVCFIFGRKTILNKLLPDPLPSHSGSFTPPKAEPERLKIEEPYVTCPNCQARNRNRILSSGQKLVCGQCKTVLLSVS